jgi:uncharacterized membrane protein
MKKRKAPLVDIGFSGIAACEAMGEFAGYLATGNQDLLEMALDSGWTSLAYLAKGIGSYVAGWCGEDETKLGEGQSVNGVGIGINTIAGSIKDLLVKKPSKSVTYNLFTPECFLSVIVNAAELKYKKD